MCFSPNMSLLKLTLNKQLIRLIETILGKRFHNIKEQGPAIVEFKVNQTPAPCFTAAGIQKVPLCLARYGQATVTSRDQISEIISQQRSEKQ